MPAVALGTVVLVLIFPFEGIWVLRLYNGSCCTGGTPRELIQHQVRVTAEDACRIPFPSENVFNDALVNCFSLRLGLCWYPLGDSKATCFPCLYAPRTPAQLLDAACLCLCFESRVHIAH